jgi:hypothetical protein
MAHTPSGLSLCSPSPSTLIYLSFSSSSLLPHLYLLSLTTVLLSLPSPSPPFIYPSSFPITLNVYANKKKKNFKLGPKFVKKVSAKKDFLKREFTLI